MARPSERRPNHNGAPSAARPRRLPGRQVGVLGPDRTDRQQTGEHPYLTGPGGPAEGWDGDTFAPEDDHPRPGRSTTRGERRSRRDPGRAGASRGSPRWDDRRGGRRREESAGRRRLLAPGAGRDPAAARTRLRPSDATVARISAAALWALVLLAAYGGVTALAGSPDATATGTTPPAPGEQPDGRWAAAGFAERYLAAYLAAGADGSALSPYLGYTPELPPTAEPARAAGPVRTVDVTLAEEGTEDYWSVTVAVTEGDGESFWQAAVDTRGGQPVAVGLPAPVAGPPEPDRVALAVTLGQPAADDPMVDSVEGFLAAYLCGAADLDRYLHPDLDLQPAEPAVCSEVEVTRWGSAPEPPGEGSAATGERQTVAAEVVFDAGPQGRQGTYGLTLAQRDGRWEIAELLPAPPTKER